jgi:Holliday junction resolvase
MGRMQKRKGSRTEREFANLINGKRVPLSGAAKHAGEEHTGDVVGLGLRWECKARKDGFKTLYKWLSEESVDALAIKADRKDWLAVMPIQTLMMLLGLEEF